VIELQVPTDGGEWVRSTYRLSPATFYGGAEAKAFARREQASEGDYTAAHPLVERSADGDFTVGELGGGSGGFGADRTSLLALPHDPAALLAVLRTADVGTGERSQADRVLQAASIVLNSGVAGAALQAAVFQALEHQPGLAVLGRAADATGRHGAAIGAVPSGSKYDAEQLILDPDTGAYLGDRTVAQADQGVVPAGTVVASTSVAQR
jgi:hypothetical protein